MGGDANGAAAIAANAAEGTTRGDGSGFAAAGAAAGARGIPGIAGAAGEAIVGFVGHEEFGSVRAAEEDCAGGAKALDDGGGAARSFVGAEKRTGGIGPAGDVEAAFYGERDAVKRADGFVMSNGLGRDDCIFASGFRIEMNEGVYFRLESGDAGELGIDYFDRRNLFGAEKIGELREG